MKIRKNPIYPERVRKVPPQFSWVDHRLVRDGHIESLSHAAAALYLFLLTVADHQGLSYYGDASIEKRLSMDDYTLQTARENLIRTGLIAWKKPIYQVLDMDVPRLPMTEFRINAATSSESEVRVKNGQPKHIGEIIKRMVGGVSYGEL